MSKLIQIIALFCTFKSVISFCGVCDHTKCITPTNCNGGTVYDQCYCCSKCAKVEGEQCGGLRYKYGECDSGLICMARDIRDNENRMKNATMQVIGRCEKEQCPILRCKFGQHCIVEERKAKCICPKQCFGLRDSPVCGDRNGKRYANECELRKEECRIGKRIGLSGNQCLHTKVSHVTCTHETMIFAIRRSYLEHMGTSDFTLVDGNCAPSINATHITFTTDLNGCGTHKWFTLTSVIYSNVVRSIAKSTTSNITRKKIVYIPFECEYRLRQRNRNKVMFRPIDNTINEESLQRLQRSSKHFKTKINLLKIFHVSLPVKHIPKHGDFTIGLSNCAAVPIPKVHRANKKTIILNGCPTMNEVKILSTNSSYINLSVPKIEFVGCKVHGFAIKCRVRICPKSENDGSTNACEPECKKRSRRNVDFIEQKHIIELDTEIEAQVSD